MATANIVWIDGVAYAPNHPKVKQSGAGGPLIVPMEASVGNDSKPKTARTNPFISVYAEARLNKTETRWLQHLRAEQFQEIRIWPITLKLAEDLRYTPDFSITIECSGVKRIRFYEVKGAHIWPKNMQKLRMAAKIFPEFDFWLAQWSDGKWTESLMPK